MSSFGFIIVAMGLSVADETSDPNFRSGKYDAAIELAGAEVERGVWNEKWAKLLIRSQLARGQYAEALKVYQGAIGRYSQSVTMRSLGRDVYLANNRPKEAEAEADQIFAILQQSAMRLASSDSMVAAGRYFVLRQEDARQVLAMFYDRVRLNDPEHLGTLLATAELAIQKGDFQVAAQTLEIAQRVDDADPRVGYLQSLAWETADPAKATEALQRSLRCNPSFVPSLLRLVDNAIDAERFDDAETLITQVLKINVHDWSAWAYLAVISHLQGQYEREQLMRAAALSPWTSNPAVDHLIGKKLSDNYRFEEGAAYQRQSLAMDTASEPAKFQLAQDLLRLGEDAIGWQIASDVAKEDPYNVVAHNLVTLSDRLKEFTVLRADGLQVRMSMSEAEIYGDRVLDLLTTAKQTLCDKYDVVPRAPIIVEIYPEQKDFAIRTFGLPGGAGYLGVCFGRVITANSPASQGPRPSNWEAVLWHEFCHAVTLEKSNNRMPRWLSEGISVYEERNRDPSWGQAITPTFRSMLLEDLTPVSRLSGSFLRPPSPMHLQFAYYHSSLVVQFLVDRFGINALKSLLVELGNGLSINDAITKTMRPIETIDVEFAAYAQTVAGGFAPDANWEREPKDESAETVWTLIRDAGEAMTAKQWDDAKRPLTRLVELGVVYPERDGPLEQLAIVYAKLGDNDAELATLKKVDEISSDALAVVEKLIDHARDTDDWDAMLGYAKKWVAIQPLLPLGYDKIADAATRLGKHDEAASALRSMAKLPNIDPAAIDLRTAEANFELGKFDDAKRSVLRAIEVAPRYRDAHRLLIKIVNAKDKSAP